MIAQRKRLNLSIIKLTDNDVNYEVSMKICIDSRKGFKIDRNAIS